MSTSTSEPAQRTALRALVPLGAACILTALGWLVPLLSPLLVALILGAAVSNSRLGQARLLRGQAGITKFLLRWGVVLLGLRLSITDVVSVGWCVVAVIVLTVIITYTSTVMLGRRLGLPSDLVMLVAAGFSICGAAAIAAVSDAVRARQRDVALAVALVTILGTVMICAVPVLASILDLTTTQSSIWAGASIHEVAQVVAASSLLGNGAVAVATTVKLGRVALLAPTYAVVARRSGGLGSSRIPMLPWFVVGFAAAVAVRSIGLLPGEALQLSNQFTTVLLAAGMFGLGLGLRVTELWPVPLRALILATFSTFIAAGSSLLLILSLRL